MQSADTQIAACLSLLTSKDWTSLKADSSASAWSELDWWHNKAYVSNPPNLGTELQQPSKGPREIPYHRHLFHPSPRSRFSLGTTQGVAYFSSDMATNICETIEPFYNDDALRFDELVRYLNGDINPTPGWHFYPLAFYLRPNAAILNLTSVHTPIFKLLAQRSQSQISIWPLIQSRDSQLKTSTQLIAIQAYKFGFDGIVYESVRGPVDAVLPASTLVIFNPDSITAERPRRS